MNLLNKLERAALLLPDPLLPSDMIERKRDLERAEQKRALELELHAAGYSRTHARAEVANRFSRNEK